MRSVVPVPVLEALTQKVPSSPPFPLPASTYDDTILGHLVDNDAYDSEVRADAVRGRVQIFFVAGHDTTGYTVAWLLCELDPGSPAALSAPRAYATISRALSRRRRHRTSARVRARDASPLAGRCAGLLARDSRAHIELADGTCTPLAVPSASCPSCCSTAWLADIPAPDEWRPERWLDGEGKLRTPEGLQPGGFSLGPRNCVGQALAMAEFKRVTAALASRFVFEAVEPPTPDGTSS